MRVIRAISISGVIRVCDTVVRVGCKVTSMCECAGEMEYENQKKPGEKKTKRPRQGENKERQRRDAQHTMRGPKGVHRGSILGP